MSETLSSYPFDTVSTFRRHGKRKPHSITLMVCGRSGLGKSTFINTLCDGTIYDNELDTDKNIPQTMEITERTASFYDASDKFINLSVIDTPGFGNELECSGQIEQIRIFIEKRFDTVLNEESRINRTKFLTDTRIHCCLYFIPNSGHGLTELDIKAIATLAPIVNVIPVIAKSDTLSQSELLDQKVAVRENLDHEDVKLFDLGYSLDDEDSEHVEDILAFRQMMPLAVSGSNAVFQMGESYIRGREFGWGFARSDDSSFSDLELIRSIVFGEYMQDLKEATLGLYENYRTKVLTRNRGVKSAVTTSIMESTTAGSIVSSSSESGVTAPDVGSLRSVNV